jgi:thioredoxin reductase (NADPH)
VSVLTTDSQPSLELLARQATETTPIIVALCAAWCDTCGQFRSSFENIARARPTMLFVWLDIEDDADICGDIDVENFPTLAIYRCGKVLHFGVSLPHEATVARLIDEMAARDTSVEVACGPVAELLARLGRRSGT